MRSVLAWLRRYCRFLRVPPVGPRRGRTVGTRRILSMPCFQVVVVRRQDTTRSVWHKSSVLETCCHAPLEKSVPFRRLSRVRSVNREKLRLELRCTELALPGCCVFILRGGAGVFEGSDGWVCDARPLQSFNCLLPCLFHCLGCLLDIQLCRSLILVIKGAEIGGGSCCNHCGKRVSRGCSGGRPVKRLGSLLECAAWLL